MIRTMHLLCTGSNCVAKDNFLLTMVEMDDKGILLLFIVKMFGYTMSPTTLHQAHKRWQWK